MGKKNKGRVPKIQLDQIPKLIREEAVKKYNASPETVRIYYNNLEKTLVVIDSRFENYEVSVGDGNIFFIIGGNKYKKRKINQADISKAINDEIEYWFYIDDDIYNEF